MIVKLTPDEVRQAIREWLIARAIPVTEQTPVVFSWKEHFVNGSKMWRLITEIEDVSPIKGDPYR